MAYNRYDRGRDDRDVRSTRSEDDYRQRFRDQRHDRDERGFFERAGEQISSWFGDDEPDRGAHRGEQRFDQGRDYRRAREEDRLPQAGRSPGRDIGRDEYQPMTGDYGRATREERAMREERGSRGSRGGYGAMPASATPAHDRHYGEWRQRQIDELDRDYESYRHENQSRFESDFSNWRSTRQSKRQLLGSIREHMSVVGSDDQPVGTVDKVRGDRVILTKNDSPDGQHHSLSCAMIDRVEGDRVILDQKAEEAKGAWGSEERDRALFERDDEREPGAHILNRSFSGTY